MVEIFQLEGSECIGAHKLDTYEDPRAMHNRHDFRQNFRFQLTERELELLSQECAVIGEGIKYGCEKPLGKFWVVGSNGQLGEEDMVFEEDRYLISGRLCDKVRKEGYVEVTTPLADFSVLLKRV